jgi:Xaa-Pro aminopeptidase
MVLTVEPKLITPDFGAVNVEDDLVVTSDGYEILGSLPRCLFVVGSDGEVSRVP